jgi:hypothetical protein
MSVGFVSSFNWFSINVAKFVPEICWPRGQHVVDRLVASDATEELLTRKNSSKQVLDSC